MILIPSERKSGALMSEAPGSTLAMEGESAAPMERADKANLTHLARGAEWPGYAKNIAPKALQVNRDA